MAENKIYTIELGTILTKFKLMHFFNNQHVIIVMKKTHTQITVEEEKHNTSFYK